MISRFGPSSKFGSRNPLQLFALQLPKSNSGTGFKAGANLAERKASQYPVTLCGNRDTTGTQGSGRCTTFARTRLVQLYGLHPLRPPTTRGARLRTLHLGHRSRFRQIRSQIPIEILCSVDEHPINSSYPRITHRQRIRRGVGHSLELRQLPSWPPIIAGAA